MSGSEAVESWQCQNIFLCV